MGKYVYKNNYRPEGGHWAQFKMIGTRHNGTHEIKFVDKYEYAHIGTMMCSVFRNSINQMYSKVIFLDMRGYHHATFPLN